MNVHLKAIEVDKQTFDANTKRAIDLKTLHTYQRNMKKLYAAMIRTEEMQPSERDIKIIETTLWFFKKD